MPNVLMNLLFSKIGTNSSSIFTRTRHAVGLSETSVRLPKMTAPKV